MSSADAAEFAKIAETTFRNVNIALANEFAKFSQENGLDIFEVIEASNSQPFSLIHQPGIAVGGHCIPVYPKFYFIRSTQPDSRILLKCLKESLNRENKWLRQLIMMIFS